MDSINGRIPSLQLLNNFGDVLVVIDVIQLGVFINLSKVSA